jgi:hypothetical protein
MWVLVACGDGDTGPAPIAEGILALDGDRVVAVDVDAQTVTQVGRPIPPGLSNPRLLASLDNTRLVLTGGVSGSTALYVFRLGNWEAVVSDATAVFNTIDLAFYGYRRDIMSTDPGMWLFSADGTMVYQTDDPSVRAVSSLDGSHAFVRDEDQLRIFPADGSPELSFNPTLFTDWRPRLGTSSRVFLGPSDIGSWYSFDGVMGESVMAAAAGVGYLLEEDGRLTYALDDVDVEVATMLPADATRAITSDASQVLIDDGDFMRVFSPDGTEIAAIVPELYAGDPPAGAPPPELVRLGDIAASIPNAGVFITNQSAADGTPSLSTIVHFRVDGGVVSQDVLTALPTFEVSDPLGDRPDERVVTWAEGSEVHYVDPLTGETGAFDGLTSVVSWARYPGARGHRTSGE